MNWKALWGAMNGSMGSRPGGRAAWKPSGPLLVRVIQALCGGMVVLKAICALGYDSGSARKGLIVEVRIQLRSFCAIASRRN